MFDCHMHTHLSGDSQAQLAQMCQAALQKGIGTLCITEHVDIGHPDKEILFLCEPYREREQIERAREQFPQMTILWGLEVGYMPATIAQTRLYAQRYELDYLLYSVHVAGGWDCYDKEYYEGLTRHQAYLRYLDAVYDSLLAWDGFDCMGHLGYIAKCAPYADPALRLGDYREAVEAILQRLVEMGKGLEINTSSFQKTGGPMPEADILRRYREMGGEIATIGSDAHAPEAVGQHFKQALALAEAAGFERLCYFKGHEPVFEPIEKMAAALR